jgi:hypothetical protein
VSRKFLDPDHPMFRPLWVRLLVVAVCAGAAVFEFADGSPLFGMIFAALGVYAAAVFVIAHRSRRNGGGKG